MLATETRRALELVTIFLVGPLLFTLLPARVPIWIVVGALACGCAIALLRDGTFDRSQLVQWHLPRSARRGMVTRACVIVPVLAVATLLVAPNRWLLFPTTQPLRWLLVMLLYPIVSVYAQGLVYRAFFFHRYERLFRTRAQLVLGSAAVFAFAHIALLNWIAPIATLIGGYCFADAYRRTRSLPAACIEHALYGCVAFTFGIGWYFYSGSRDA